MTKLTLEELLQDALICEKFMLSMYDQFVKEASNENLMGLLLKNYEDTLNIQHDIFLEMKERNFYPVTVADKQKIEQSLFTIKEKTKSYSKDFK